MSCSIALFAHSPAKPKKTSERNTNVQFYSGTSRREPQDLSTICDDAGFMQLTANALLAPTSISRRVAADRSVVLILLFPLSQCRLHSQVLLALCALEASFTGVFHGHMPQDMATKMDQTVPG